jgi:tetratricopeptide (TPR) repeat protein
MYQPGMLIQSIPELDAYIDWLYQHQQDYTQPVFTSQLRPVFDSWAQGQMLENDGLYDQAIERYRNVLRTYPDFANARFSWARCLQASGRYTEALSQLQVLAATHPDDYNTWVQIGLVHRQMGQKTDERTAYERAIHVAPDNLYARLNLGLVCRELGDLDASASALEQALAWAEAHAAIAPEHAYDPELSKLYFEFGRTEFARCSLERAQRLFEAELSLRSPALATWADPQHNAIIFFSRLFLARIALRQGRKPEALQQLAACQALAPEDGNLNLLMGNAQSGGNDPYPLAWIWEREV